MPHIRLNADHVTMINYFRVDPSDQAGLMQVQMEDIDLFGRAQAGMLAASFHRSFDGTRVFNYAHWTSLEALSDWRGSPDMAAHIERMAPFSFEIDPHPFAVVAGTTDGPFSIEAKAAVTAGLLMVETGSQTQADVVARLKGFLVKDAPMAAGVVVGWVLASTDAVRAAAYLQFASASAYRAVTGSAAWAGLEGDLARMSPSFEMKAYEVGAAGRFGQPTQIRAAVR